MANLTNPALSMAAASGVLEALLERSPVPSAAGVVPSGTATDYATYLNIANAVALELDGLLGAGFDVQLASNATPGITVGGGPAAGTAALATYVKPNTMKAVAKGVFAGRFFGSTTPADYAGIAAGIKACYQEWVTVVYANAS